LGWNREGVRLRGSWRLFRHEAGLVAGPPAWVYVLLFALSQLIGHWSVATYGAVTVWLSNGIMAAALLQLHRRPAVAVLTACFTINILSNIVRGDPGMFLWINALMNVAEAALVALLARRFCGAALDMRRPGRLARFAVIAAVSIAVVGGAGFVLMGLLRQPTLAVWLFKLKSFFVVELVGMLLVTPVLLLFARAHRFTGMTLARAPEAAALMALMTLSAVYVFWQSDNPLLFLTFPPMLLIALRLSPTMGATALIVMAGISGVGTLTGHGPVQLTRLIETPGLEAVPAMLRRLDFYNLYMLTLVVTVLPLSTVMSERRRLVSQLRARTVAAQDARRRAEDAAAARSRFLAMMSHEMRTPLNGVAGFADLLAAREGLDEGAVRQARKIRESSDGLLMLVEDILDFARGDDALTPEALDLAEVAREAATPSRMTTECRGVSLTIDSRLPDAARFAADRRALRRTLHPLIANAAKFTDKGEIVVRLDRAADGVAIRVSDTGCGIAPELLPDLFEAFAQGDASIRRNHSGAGLGLALAARHAARMGGRIEVDSRPGEGSTFTLTLPLERLPDAEIATESPETRDESLEAETDMPPRAPRVLVVDDHPVNREVARIMLEALGCAVTEVCDGVDAVTAVQAEPFDLVLMDVRMPRMDGLEATRRIRALPGDVGALAIVAMTADAMPEDVAGCLASGMNAHMAKPINQAGLYDAVSRALSGELTPARVSEAA
jgi:two-component system, sensor histidine kinase